jgi:hypothetical protein
MQLRKTLLVGLVSVALLSGCSLFNSEEDVVTMSPLPKVSSRQVRRGVPRSATASVSSILTCVLLSRTTLFMLPIATVS